MAYAPRRACVYSNAKMASKRGESSASDFLTTFYHGIGPDKTISFVRKVPQVYGFVTNRLAKLFFLIYCM